MWLLLYAGAASGRKGVPESIRSHPLVFATLTPPGLGPVHGTRTGGGLARCQPPRGKPMLCGHGRPTWHTRIQTDGDPGSVNRSSPTAMTTPDAPPSTGGRRSCGAGSPSPCGESSPDGPGPVRRRSAGGVGCRASRSPIFQRRAVVHFHALIRLEAPGDGYNPPPLASTAADLAEAIREAAASVAVTVGSPG